MAIQDVLREWVLYNGADKQVGRVESFTPPTLEKQIEDVRMGGMDTSMPVDMGMTAMESTWTTAGIDKTTYAGFGLMAGVRTTVKVRAGVMDPISGKITKVEHELTGDIYKIEPAAYKAGERAGLQTAMKLVFYKLTHGGTVVTEIDVINGVRKINGKDQLAELKAATGR